MKKFYALLWIIFELNLVGIAQNRTIFPVRMDELDLLWMVDLSQVPKTDSSGLWNYGHSSKNDLQPDSQDARVMITDSLNLLSGNHFSFVDYLIPKIDYYDNIHFTIKHKYDFNELSGGSILISTDSGDNFYPIWSDSVQSIPYWWYDGLYSHDNLLYNGEAGFTGKSVGTIQTEINLTFVLLVKKTLKRGFLIRFLYQSADSAQSHGGWMIESIDLKREYRSGGVKEGINGKTLLLFPNPINDKIQMNAPEKGLFQMINSKGEIVLEVSLPYGLKTIYLPAFPEGIYSYVYKSDQFIDKGKLVILRN